MVHHLIFFSCLFISTSFCILVFWGTGQRSFHKNRRIIWSSFAVKHFFYLFCCSYQKAKSETKANLYSKLQDKNTTKQPRLPPIHGLFKDNSTCWGNTTLPPFACINSQHTHPTQTHTTASVPWGVNLCHQSELLFRRKGSLCGGKWMWMAWKGFREFMCERGAWSLRLSVWGSRSDSLTEGERQQTGAEHTRRRGKWKEKGKGQI